MAGRSPITRVTATRLNTPFFALHILMNTNKLPRLGLSRMSIQTGHACTRHPDTGLRTPGADVCLPAPVSFIDPDSPRTCAGAASKYRALPGPAVPSSVGLAGPRAGPLPKQLPHTGRALTLSSSECALISWHPGDRPISFLRV